MSAERYKISECELDVLAITGPEGTYYIDGENIEARAIRQQSADIAELRAELNRERETNAGLRRDLADPPPDIQELALKKCGHFEIVAKLRADLAAAVAEPEPVAWMWNDELGIPHVSAGQKKPVWVENGLSSHMAKIVNLRPLYAAPPAPVAEIRDVVVTDEMCDRAYIGKWRGVPELIGHEPDDEDRQWSREWLEAWRSELGPALGLVEIREPTPEECERISMAYYDDEALVDRDHRHLGKDMFIAVRAIMWPKEGL